MAVHPLRPAIHRRLGGPLPHQLANGTQDSLLAHIAFIKSPCGNFIISGISCRFQQLSQSKRQVSYALLTRPPSSIPRRKFRIDLHVLSILSAFILSQDQTLHSNILNLTVLIYTFFYIPLIINGFVIFITSDYFLYSVVNVLLLCSAVLPAEQIL